MSQRRTRAAVLALALTISPSPAFATGFPVWDALANIWHGISYTLQGLQHAIQSSELYQVTASALNTLKSNLNEAIQITQGIRNLASWPFQVLGQLMGAGGTLIGDAYWIVSSANTLTYETQNLPYLYDNTYRFTPLGAYTNFAAVPNNSPDTWSHNALESQKLALQVSHEHSAAMPDQQANLSRFQDLAQSATGNVEAIQANAGINAEGVKRLQEMKQLQMAGLQQTADHYAWEESLSALHARQNAVLFRERSPEQRARWW